MVKVDVVNVVRFSPGHILFVAILCLVGVGDTTDDLPGEVEQCRRLAPKYDATAEVRLVDDSRVDLINNQYAIEVDWSPKWAEAIGQSIHYSLMSGKDPAVLLLVKDPKEEWRHLVRAARVCGHLGIMLYVEERKPGQQ